MKPFGVFMATHEAQDIEGEASEVITATCELQDIEGVSGDMPPADISSEHAAGDAEPAAAGSEHAASGAASAAEPDGSLAEPPPTASGAQSCGSLAKPPRRYTVRHQIDRAAMHRLEGHIKFTDDEIDPIVKTPTVQAFDGAD